MTTLRFTSCMAANADPVVEKIVAYVGDRLQTATEFVNNVSWQERESLLDQGAVQVGWICGLPYIDKADRDVPAVLLLAAPVMQGDRYQDRPVYFSDVVVRRDSPFQSFADLRGKVWAYNEPRSHSGYYVTRSHLFALGETEGFFDKTVASGAHQRSLELILKGEVDASAIDSTVLETELQKHPEIAAQIRIIETLGPSPIPPWVISPTLPESLQTNLRQILIQMHTDPEGKALLNQGGIARFAAVSDRDYDPIRLMAQQAAKAKL